MAKDRFELEGVVTDANRNLFKVKIKLENGKEMELDCTISGKLRQNYIKILKGDKVTVDVSSADPTNGRIIWRDK